MSFLEDLIVDLGREALLGSFKYIGVATKWFFYLGKRPISEIMKQNWNTRIGFLVFIILILLIVYLVN